ncbi:MAG: 16S rRNA (guanine(527)-N(7))-methyltransferase RsmG [Acidimicrobiales bacterium]
MTGPDRLVGVLERARAVGLLGPGPVEVHLAHAEALVSLLGRIGVAPRVALDLGSGGGVPGLILALGSPSSRWTLLDAAARRTAFLEAAVRELELDDRVQVVQGRAEVVGRDPQHRGRYDLVTARSFGPPAVTAECGAPLLRVGGWLAVSEPPEPAPERWPARELAELGLEVVAQDSWMLAQQQMAAPEQVPRRDGIPRKRPRW